VLICVTDTGDGMSEEIVAKAFEPFFTTKEVGKGTGLGLSQVYGFVRQSGGHVNIYSEVGVGTSVKIYLPRFIGGDDAGAERDKSVRLLRGDVSDLVLVVEDEEAMRQFSVDALRDLGYRVVEAPGAERALELLATQSDIKLLFTDVVMPGMNGARLSAAALELRPDLKVLYTTGYTRNAVVHNGVLDPGVQLIGKPFTVEALASKLREVLDAS
jgi:CheY-like chemotaxis protein